MRIPITKYGLPQAAAYPAALGVLMAAYGLFLWRAFPESLQTGAGLWLAGVLPEAILLVVLIWAVSFFRDPHRDIPEDPALLLAPADGVISDIEQVHEPTLGDGPVLRIGIFLSIFNVHINRMPCAVRVESITYKPGKFLNAMKQESGRVNESNNLLLERTVEPTDRLLSLIHI